MKNEHQEQQTVLLEHQKELRNLLGRFAAKDPKVADEFRSRFPNYGSADEENADEVAAYQDELGIEHDLERALRDVDAALAAVADGTYGACRICGKPIEADRLAVIPSTTLCLEHKTVRE